MGVPKSPSGDSRLPFEISCRVGYTEHDYWPNGRPQNVCSRCMLINQEMSRFIRQLSERARFLDITWEEALERQIDDAIWRLEHL